MPDIEPCWTVEFSGKASKQKEKLPGEIQDNLATLVIDLKWKGPEQPNWRNYGKLLGKGKKQDIRHCHLNSGKPRYVAIWKVVDLGVQIMEIRYVGTHENADYGRIS